MRSSLQRRSAVVMLMVIARFGYDAMMSISSPPAPTYNGQPNNTVSTASSSSSSSGISYEVTHTNFGWTTPQSTTFQRSILSGEFFNATLAHPRYNASAWADLEANPDPHRQIIVFLDIDTCIETNYPIYGAPNWKVNIEKNHPARGKSAIQIVNDACPYIEKASRSPALTAHPDSRLILLDCGGINKLQVRKICASTGAFSNGHMMVVYFSVNAASVRPLFDVGIPPPAIKAIPLSQSDREAIQSCTKRKYLFSFQGRRGFGREGLHKFDNDPEFFIRIFDERDQYKTDIRTDGQDSNNYTGIMKDSTFAGSPRGDLLFSYRFSEILSAGAIPVVYADGWLPPFNSHVIDWEKCAVFIPESDFDKTAEILRAIPEEKQCEMQKCALNAWDKFVSSRAGWVRALIAVALSTSAFGVDPVADAIL